MIHASLSLFLEFELPNATTWFYLSWLLSVALFFKFTRLISIRNLDILTLFLLAPGILLVQKSAVRTTRAPADDPLAAASTIGLAQAGPLVPIVVSQYRAYQDADADLWRWIGYLWLLCGSGVLFLRCLWDIMLVQRPALAPNLNGAGLAWLALALLGCLTAVAFRQQLQPTPPVSASHDVVGPNAPTVGREGALVSTAKKRLAPWIITSVAILCHLATLLGLLLIGRLHFQNIESGMAAATCYLLLPYTGFFSGQIHHIGPVTLIIWSLVFYRSPLRAGLLLGVAAGIAYFPALLLLLWLSFYGKNGAGRFLLAFLFGLAVTLGILLLLRGEGLATIYRETMQNTGWQPWRVPTAVSFWTGMPWAYRLPVFIAYLAFLLSTAFWPIRKTLAHLIALSSALLIGVQFWYADQGGLYVLWYLPLFILMVFRPNLKDAVAPVIVHRPRWPAMRARIRRLLGLKELTKQAAG